MSATTLLAGVAPPLTEQAQDIDRVWDLFLVIAAIVGLLVLVLVLYSVVRFRRRDDRLPRQVHYNIPFEIAYTIVPLLIVIGLFAVTFVSVRAIGEVDDENDLVVEVVGFQWQWQFTYPEHGVTVLGTESEVPELVLPAGAKVRFDLESVDVIHSFWIPGFRYKRDMFPGQSSSFEVDIRDRTGAWPNTGVCAEFCGLDHDTMRFSVRIVDAAEFDEWVSER